MGKKICKIGAALFLGALSAFLLIEAVDLSFGFFVGKDPAPFWQDSEPNENGQKTNREILGLMATQHGIFPAVPPPINGKIRQVPTNGELKNTRGNKIPFRDLPFLIMGKTEHELSVNKKGEVLYDRAYDVDAFGRRVTPGEEKKKARDYLLMIGCSYTFGTIVQGNETLAYYLGQKMPQTRVYNYGLAGASPGEIWLREKVIHKDEEVPEPSGTVTYLFINDHINRLIGRASVLGRWGSHRIHFYRDGNSIKYDGMFYKVWPIRTLFYEWLMSLNMVRYFHVDYPIRYRPEDFAFFADTVLEMQKTAQQQLGAKKFYLIFYPNARLSTQLIPYLEARGISYIDYSHWDLDLLTHGLSSTPYDGHPTAEANEVLAKDLARVLSASSTP